MSSQYAEDMAPTAIPAILAYRRGDLIANLVHFVDEIPPGKKVDEETVQQALRKYLASASYKTNLAGRVY